MVIFHADILAENLGGARLPDVEHTIAEVQSGGGAYPSSRHFVIVVMK